MRFAAEGGWGSLAKAVRARDQPEGPRVTNNHFSAEIWARRRLPVAALDGPPLPLTLERPYSGIPSEWTKTSSTYANLRTSRAGFWIEWLATYLERLPTRRDVWRAALLGTLTGAAVVIAWIEVVHRASL